MNYKALIKKQSTMIAIVVICLTIATIGVSYALFFQVETNTNNQLVKAGSLKVEYGSGSSAISATELVPMSDAEAESSSNMTGTIYIENTGTLPASYEVKLGDDVDSFSARKDANESDELLSHKYIRVAAYLNGEKILEPTTLADIEYASDDKSMHSLFKDKLNVSGTGESTATIVLKVWINENAPESIIGDFVYLKMDVTSEVLGADAIPKEGTDEVKVNDNAGDNLISYQIYGNSVQDGDPSITSPIEVKSVGDLVTDEDDDNYGKYKIPVKVSGKNLFDVNAAGSISNWDIISYRYYPVYVGKGNTVTVSYNDNNPELEMGLDFYFLVGINESQKGYANGGEWLYHSTTESLINNNITFDATEDYIYLNVAGSLDAADSNILKNNFMIEINDKKTDYEPYIEPTTTNIYLTAPLRKIDNYSDYIDFENQKVVRKIGEVVYNGSDDHVWSNYTSSKGYMVANTEFINDQPVMSNMFINSQINVSTLAVRKNYDNLYVYGVSDTYSTLDAWESHLKANNLKVIGKLSSPYDEDIKLPDIKIIKGTNIISVETETEPSKLIVLYNPS